MEILFVKKNTLQDLISSLNAVISTNESTEFITGHVIYTYKFQLKTTGMAILIIRVIVIGIRFLDMLRISH